MTDELIMPYKQALSNECHSRALDDVLTVSVITNTVVPADHDVPIVRAAIKEPRTVLRSLRTCHKSYLLLFIFDRSCVPYIILSEA